MNIFLDCSWWLRHVSFDRPSADRWPSREIFTDYLFNFGLFFLDDRVNRADQSVARWITFESFRSRIKTTKRYKYFHELSTKELSKPLLQQRELCVCRLEAADGSTGGQQKHEIWPKHHENPDYHTADALKFDKKMENVIEAVLEGHRKGFWSNNSNSANVKCSICSYHITFWACWRRSSVTMWGEKERIFDFKPPEMKVGTLAPPPPIPPPPPHLTLLLPLTNFPYYPCAVRSLPLTLTFCHALPPTPLTHTHTHTGSCNSC